MEGNQLTEALCLNTGLPVDLVRAELELLCQKKGIEMNNLNLDHLRDLLAEYLQDVLLQAAKDQVLK